MAETTVQKKQNKQVFDGTVEEYGNERDTSDDYLMTMILLMMMTMTDKNVLSVFKELILSCH